MSLKETVLPLIDKLIDVAATHQVHAKGRAALCAALDAADAAREYLAAPEQSEPIAKLFGTLPVFASPQPTELTDEQINEIGVRCAVVGEAFWSESHIEFARAILAAQKAKV
jgi:hypothetical protein